MRRASAPEPPRPRGPIIGNDRKFRSAIDPTDDARTLTNAIAYAQERVIDMSRAPLITVDPDDYHWRTPIIGRSASVRFEGSPNSGSRIYWDGPTNVSAVTKSPTDAGGSSWWQFNGACLRPGEDGPTPNEPDAWLEVTTPIDSGFRLSETQFIGGGCAVKATSWINLWFGPGVRIDSPYRYAFEFTPVGGVNLGSAALTGFTYDHGSELQAQRVARPGLGFVHVDNTANFSNLGLLVLRDARIEVNVPWANAGPQALFAIKKPDSAANATVCGWALDAITLDVTAEGAMSHACVLHQDTASTTTYEEVALPLFRQQGLTSIFGGAVPAAIASAMPAIKTRYVLEKLPS